MRLSTCVRGGLVAGIALIFANDARADGLVGRGGLAAPIDCETPEDQAALAAALGDYERNFGPLSSASGLRGVPPLFPFYPLAGTLYGDLFTNNFVDLDPTSVILDWDCTDFAYNGHDATDVDLRSFGEQAIGVPIFAALDGTVVAAHDGEPDMNQCPNVPCGTPPNYVAIDHGNGRICYYLHMKLGSVSVSVGQHVRAGEQIGLVGSSGNSSWPHLHFATYDDGILVEPYAGPCRPGTSEWVDQTPIERNLYLRDFGVTYEDMSLGPGLPAALPRSGQLALADPFVYFWALPINLPAASTWLVRFQRPNGTIAFDTGTHGFGNPVFYRASWWWWQYNVSAMHTTTGTWHIQLHLNGVLVVSAPVEVRAARTSDFNHPPEPISVVLEPAVPTEDDAVTCRVATSLVLDDLDYDIVRYEYVWTVNDVEVRHVTSAAHSDMIPHHTAAPGDTVQCVVTPSDGVAAGPSASASVIIAAGSADFDGDGDVDLADFAAFSQCFGGPSLPPAGGCPPGVDADLDGDSDVDLADFALFSQLYTGAL